MKAELAINRADISDLEEILKLQKTAYLQEAEIYNDFSIPPLTQEIDSLKSEWQNGIVIKAEMNGQIIGSVRAKLVDNICKIGKLIVKPDFQNQGVGRKLMIEIERLFKACSTYELFTGDKSDKNLTFYRKLGYADFKTEGINENLKMIYLQKRKQK
jgi:N-acetylglutamate synthase-like GNAT family acetyltransferase